MVFRKSKNGDYRMYNHEFISFITAADHGSFLKAVQALYTTPASVMNQMNKLEKMRRGNKKSEAACCLGAGCHPNRHIHPASLQKID